MCLRAEETEAGLDLNLISLKSKMSGLPRALIANLQATLFGKHRHVAEVPLKTSRSCNSYPHRRYSRCVGKVISSICDIVCLRVGLCINPLSKKKTA